MSRNFGRYLASFIAVWLIGLSVIGIGMYFSDNFKTAAPLAPPIHELALFAFLAIPAVIIILLVFHRSVCDFFDQVLEGQNDQNPTGKR